MTSRLLTAFGLVALTAGFAIAQDGKPSIKDQVKEAQEVANEDLPKAIAILEKALKAAPEDHNALFLLGAMSVVQAEKSEGRAERFAMYRKSTDAFARILKIYKTVTPNEQRFLTMSRVGEARVLAFEGKPDQALAAIKKATEVGYDDFDALKADKDLESVSRLPEFKALVEKIYAAKLAEARKEVAEEMASFKPFPFDFQLKDVEGKPVALVDFKGKATIVDVWGTWCPPCRMEIPHFVELHAQYQPKGLEIVGINCNEEGTPEEVNKTIKAFIAKTKIPYKCAINDGKTEEKIPGFQGYPTTLFLDGAGKVRFMQVGYIEKSKLEAIVTALLADAAKPGPSGEK